MGKTVATILLFLGILFIANSYLANQAVSTPVATNIEVVAPAAASETSTTKKADPLPSLWTCSTDETVIYMVIEGNNQNFTVFASNGAALGQAVSLRKGPTMVEYSCTQNSATPQ